MKTFKVYKKELKNKIVWVWEFFHDDKKIKAGQFDNKNYTTQEAREKVKTILKGV